MQILEEFLNYLQSNKDISQNTYLAYKKDITDFTNFLSDKSLTLLDITQKDYIDFVNFLKSQKISKSTAYRKISATKLFAKYLSSNFNTPEFKEKPKIDTKLPLVANLNSSKIDLTELNSYTASQLREKIIIYLLRISNLSVNQLAVLETKNFNLITGFLKLNNKIIKLDPEFLIILKHYLRTIEYSTKYLFPVNFQNIIKPISKQTIWAILRSNFANKNINLDKINPQNKAKSIFDLDSKTNIEIYRKTHPRENSI